MESFINKSLNRFNQISPSKITMPQIEAEVEKFLKESKQNISNSKKREIIILTARIMGVLDN